MRLVTLVICLLVSSAHAGTPVIGIAAQNRGGSVSHARVTIEPRIEHTIVRLALTVTTEATFATNVRTTLTLPARARVVGMHVTLGDGPSVQGVPLFRRDAFDRYRAITDAGRDPALVEYIKSDSETAQYLVQVFPVVRDTPARVELEIQIPPTRALQVKTSSAIPAFEVVNGDVTTERLETSTRIAIAKATERDTSAPRQAVNDGTSLFADEPGRLVVPDGPSLVLEYGAQPAAPGEPALDQADERAKTYADTARQFRRLLRNHTRVIRSCLTKMVPQVRIDLRFAIVPNGQVSAVSVNGDASDDAKRCVAAEIATWRFEETADVRMVSYPVITR